MEKLSFLLYLCLLQTLHIHSIQSEQCLPSKETITKLENQHGVQISKMDHHINFNCDENIVIKDISVDVTEIYLEKIEVNFTAISENINAQENSTDLIAASFSAQDVKVYRLKRKSPLMGLDTYDCIVINWNKSQLRTNSTKVKLIIKNLTELCIEDSICKQYDATKSSDSSNEENEKHTTKSNTKNQSDLQIQNPKFFTNNRKQEQVSCNTLATEQNYNPQSTINAIFDFAVSAVITIVAGNEDGVMHLPHIDKDYKFAGVTGEFLAFNGTFIDLRALYRVKDVVFTNKKDRFMVATSFRLLKAKLNFPSYKLRYGYAKINGHLDVDIENITVSLKLAADYNASPCQIHLVDLTMDELGETNVDFTGLGWPLNSAVRMAIRYIIEYKVFQVAKDIAAVKMKELNCEQFRPSLDMFNNSTDTSDNKSVNKL